jgi:polyhydroxyalkanoate synthesis repressor PhaR
MLRGNNSGGFAGNPSKVVLKKYGKNRRLYDTSAKRYVNLDELAAMIRSGIDVQVVDAKTGEDITRVCLMQIVMEDTKEKPTGLPLEMLRQLVVASDHVGREFIMWYLQSAFDTYKKVQGAMETGLTGVQSVATSPLQTLRNFVQSTTSEKKSEETKKSEESEIQELRQRIADLEARAAKPAKRARKPRTPKSPVQR